MTTLRDQIQSALQSALKTSVAEVSGRVFVEIDRPYVAGDYPCINVVVGTATGEYVAGGGAGPGERLVNVDYEVSLDVVDDATVVESRARTKVIASSIRRALARFQALMPTPSAVDYRFRGEVPFFMPSETGRLGGYVLTYSGSYLVIESDPDEAIGQVPLSF